MARTVKDSCQGFEHPNMTFAKENGQGSRITRISAKDHKDCCQGFWGVVDLFGTILQGLLTRILGGSKKKLVKGGGP